MSVWQKIRGTIETIFSLGLGGPQLKNNGGVVENRNPTDTGFAVVRGATPVAANDLTTKAYVDAAAAPGGLFVIRFALGTSTGSSTATIPAGAVVFEAAVDVTTPYSAGATISVGQTGSASLLMATTDNLATTAGMYAVPQDQGWGASALAVLATVTGAPSAGAANIIVKYSTPST